MRRLAILLAALAPAGTAQALDLPLPGDARLTAGEASASGTVRLPSGPWRDGAVPVVAAEGATDRRAWRIEGDATPDALLAPVAAALEAQGFAPVFSCADRACGGYDFRFALDLLPAPAMHVDLGNYRYLLAEGPDGSLAAVVTSTGLGAGYVHVTSVAPGPPPSLPAPAAGPADAPPPATAPREEADLAARLLADGHVVLEGLAFPSGSAALPGDRYGSLAALAAFLSANPTASVALVGHTDAVGARDANMALSRARAAAVRTRLIDAYGADPARLSAEGAGWLAPVASNLTPGGQARNRRVEAVLLSAP